MDPVELVLFRVGPARFGADAGQVLRVDRGLDVEDVGTPLGPLAEGRRALVFQDAEGRQWRLRVDLVEGVRAVDPLELRRLPAPAIHGAIPVGAWLDGDEAVLLVDLGRMAPAATAS